MLFNKGFVETKCGTKEAYSSCLKVSRNERSAFCLWNGMAFDEEGLLHKALQLWSSLLVLQVFSVYQAFVRDQGAYSRRKLTLNNTEILEVASGPARLEN